MTYSIINNRGSQFVVDWDVVRSFAKSFRLAEAQWNRSRIVSISESSLFNPLSWSLPSVYTVDCDWDLVNRDVASLVESDIYAYREASSYDMAGVARDCKNRLSLTIDYKRQFIEQLREAQSRTVDSMNSAVDNYEGAIEIARTIRDASADTLMLGSTVLAGPAAAGLLTAGATLSGVAKYQDTQSVGAAIIKGSGSLVLGAFSVSGKSMTAAGEYTLIVIQGGVEASTALASGKSFAESVKTGALKIAGGAASNTIMKAAFVKTGFDRLALPVKITDTYYHSPKDITSDSVQALAKAGLEKSTDKILTMAFDNSIHIVPKGGTNMVRQQSSGFMESVPIEQELLLYFAIINQNKGVGHGW